MRTLTRLEWTASGWWEDGTLFGPANPIGIAGFVQSNRGAPGDFEAVVVDSSGIAHHWTKHNSFPWTMAPGTWYDRGIVASNVASGGPGLVQSKLGRTGVPENGTGQLHYVCAQTDGQLHHYWLDASGWTYLTSFGAGADSAPCLIEGTYGAAQASATAGAGGGGIDMTNGNGVEIQAHTSSAGLQLTLGASGVDIRIAS